MSLDTSFHIIYGYHLSGRQFENSIEKYTSEDKDWILPNGKQYDDFLEELENGDKLQFVTDPMCGVDEYLGIPIFGANDDYGESWYVEYDKNDIGNSCDDEELDKLIQEKIPFIIGNEYDVAGMLYGELPQLYIVKRVW